MNVFTDSTTAAWPPQDRAAFFAMMQNAAAMSGQPPPPLPGFAFPPQPFLPPTPQLAVPPPPMTFPPQPPQAIMPPSQRIQEVVDSDKEDGEVSEGDAPRSAALKAKGRTFAPPPRSVPQAKQTASRIEEEYNPDRPAEGQSNVKTSAQKKVQQPAIQSPVDILQQNREQAKQFVKLLHSNNIGYRALASESLDLDQLRGLYQSLNLPSEPAPILPPKDVTSQHKLGTQSSASPAVQPVSSSSAPQPKPAPAVKTNVQAASTPSAAASPVDRKDYIARLQAAKLAKAAAAKPSPSQNTPPVTTSTPAAKALQATTTPTPKRAVTHEERARNTEKIKQRLEAMKAQKQTAPAQNNAGAVPPPATKPAASLTQQSPTTAITPTVQPFPSPFPGIPGLFMNPPPQLDPPRNLTMAPSVPQKRPAPTDTEASTPRGSVTPFTRPLGDLPHAYQEEPMIIEVSEDEDGSDMDIDDDQGPAQAVLASSSMNIQRQAPGTISDFPSRQTSVLAGSSAVSTPGPQTPATQARETELKSKEDQLAAMKVMLKKKLAEKREKDKAAAAAAAATAAPSASSNMLANTASPQTGVTSASLPQVQAPPAEPASVSHDLSGDANELIRDVKRRRREEIQSKQSSFDAELATNTDRMAQLMKEMEMLKAHNEKIARDKEQLTHELESLGVDTEGMSHAEMREKKDEIERQMSPEPRILDQGVTQASAPLTTPSINAVAATEHQSEINSVAAPHVPILEETAVQPHSLLPGLGHASQPQDDAVMPLQPQKYPDSTIADPRVQDESVTEQNIPEISTGVASDVQGFATPLDEEDFYSPAPATAAQPEIEPVDARSPSEEGEVEMSVSSEDEEEYDPEEPVVITEAPTRNAQIPEAEAATSVVPSEDVSTEDEEVYEPPDIDEDMIDAQPAESVAVSDAIPPEAEAEGDAMDIASSSSEDTDSDSDSNSSSDGEITSEAEANESISGIHTVQQDDNVADDLAPELQSASAAQPAPAADEEVHPPEFTRYQSPLRMFKSYRYHPKFAEEIAGGFLSSTFSHQIDPDKPMCQFETAGGSCNDANCLNQHFRDLGITGA